MNVSCDTSTEKQYKFNIEVSDKEIDEGRVRGRVGHAGMIAQFLAAEAVGKEIGSKVDFSEFTTVFTARRVTEFEPGWQIHVSVRGLSLE